MVYSKNKYLTSGEMKVNAQYIMSYLLGKGWTKNAIAGMLGNMQTESSINPGIWQGLNQGNMSGGFGLTQWTPATKYIDWAKAKGLDFTTMDANLQRILYEVKNNIQWDNTTMSFKQFTQSTLSPEELALMFLADYENPAESYQPIRATQARKWFTSLDGKAVITDGLQLAVFPMDVLHVTQGENSQFSHLDNYWAMDFVGTSQEYPYYAPVDAECIGRNDSAAILVWKSQREVMCADGVVRNLVWRNIHDNNLLYNVGDKIDKGDLMGHTGNSGESSGDHYHLEVYEDTEYNVNTRNKTWRHIFDVFAINDVRVINDYGYPWKTSDYVDGSLGGGSNVKDNPNKKIIKMLLSDSLNGWKF